MKRQINRQRERERKRGYRERDRERERERERERDRERERERGMREREQERDCVREREIDECKFACNEICKFFKEKQHYYLFIIVSLSNTNIYNTIHIIKFN